MKFKNTRRIALALGTVATIVTPIAATVSCGSSSRADLVIGIRPEDQPLWNKVGEQFTKATGKSVSFTWIQDMDSNYALWNGTSSMPDITLADSGWAQNGRDKGYFQGIDVRDIVSNPNNIITGQDDAYKEDSTMTYKDLNDPMMETMITKDDGSFNGMSVIYGPKITYAWKQIPVGDHTFHIINDNDGAIPEGDTGAPVPLQYYVPDGTGKVVNAIKNVVSDDKAAAITKDDKAELLYSLKGDHHRLMSSVDDIQEFISRSASQNDVKFNGDIATGAGITEASFADPFDASKVMISTGLKGYLQRINSVAKVLYDKVTSDTAKADKLNKFANNDNFKVGAFGTSAYNWGSLAYGNAPQIAAAATADEATLKDNWNLDDRNVMDETKIYSDGPNAKNTKTMDITSRTGLKLSGLDYTEFAANLGYFTGGVLGDTAADKNGADAQVAFGNGTSMLLEDGALWQWGGISDKVKGLFPDQKADDLLTSFGEPYQITGVDGYAVRKDAKGDQLDLAKKFLRFMMQSQAAADISGNKAISVVNAARAKQPQAEGAKKAGLDSVGTKPFMNGKLLSGFDAINLPTVLAKSSSTNGEKLNGVNDVANFDPYMDLFIKAAHADWGDRNHLETSGIQNHGISLPSLLKIRQAKNIKYQQSLDVYRD